MNKHIIVSKKSKVKRKTQQEALVEMLESRGSITSFEAFLLAGITRLAGQILALKKKGFKFKGETIKIKTRYCESYIKRYFLVKKGCL